MLGPHVREPLPWGGHSTRGVVQPSLGHRVQDLWDWDASGAGYWGLLWGEALLF